MKKVFVLIAAAIVGMSAMAQVQFGFKVGVDATNFWGKGFTPTTSTSGYPYFVNHHMKFNYQAGLLMEYKFSPKFAIAPEVVFATQGGKLEFDNPTMSASRREITYNLNYINVPVMFKFYVDPAFSIDLGPQVGFNVYSKEKFDVGDPYDRKDFTKAVDFGVGLGGTYNLTDNAFIQARYTMGMTKVFKSEMDCKNGNIQLALGYKF